jgi:hypothetical protein
MKACFGGMVQTNNRPANRHSPRQRGRNLDRQLKEIKARLVISTTVSCVLIYGSGVNNLG